MGTRQMGLFQQPAKHTQWAAVPGTLGTIRAVEDAVRHTRRLRDPQQRPKLLLIEADHGLAIDEGNRGCSEPQLQEFLQGRLIRSDVLVDKRNLMSRKKLFLLIAGASPGRRVQHDLLGHPFPP
jgi:hypothetical protein